MAAKKSTARLPTSLRLILVAALTLRVALALTTPPLFAPDESGHALYVRAVAVDHQFPLLSANTSWAQGTGSNEFYQPPFYYLSAAPIYLLGGDSVAGLKAIRLVNALLGTAFVFLTYVLAKRLFPVRINVAVLAAAFLAFLPMAVADSSAAGNDTLEAVLGLGVLLVILRSPESGISRMRAAVVGLLLCLAILTKSSGLLLLPSILLWAALRRVHRGRGWARPILASASALILVSPWWILRNLQYYGDPLGVDVGWPRAGGSALHRAAWVTYQWISTGFVVFGRTNELGPPIWALIPLLLPGIFGLMHIVGLLVHRRFSTSQLEMFAPGLLLCAVTVASLYSFGMKYGQGQGRYFIPALPVVSVLVCYGLWDLLALDRPQVLNVFLAGLGLYGAVTVGFYATSMQGVRATPLNPLGVDGQRGGVTGDYSSWVSHRTVPRRWEELPPSERAAASGGDSTTR